MFNQLIVENVDGGALLTAAGWTHYETKYAICLFFFFKKKKHAELTFLNTQFIVLLSLCLSEQPSFYSNGSHNIFHSATCSIGALLHQCQCKDIKIM